MVEISFSTKDKEGTEWAQVRVSDNGPGIHISDIEKIFTAGYSTRKSGLGLGLALSRGIMQSVGGKLVVEKTVMFEGVTMLMEFPAN